MTHAHHPEDGTEDLAAELSAADWRISSFSGASSSCVAVAELPGGRVALRNSNHPDDGALVVDRAAMTALVRACAAGELDDLT